MSETPNTAASAATTSAAAAALHAAEEDEANKQFFRDARRERKAQAKAESAASASSKAVTKAANAAAVESSSCGSSKLKILALHGGMQCGSTLASGQMKKVIKILRHVAEFVFLDAPFVARWPAEDDAALATLREAGTQLQNRRSWWRWNPYDPEDERYACAGHDQDATMYHHVEESLALVEGAWRDNNGFDGILGFSQGAIIASCFIEQHLRSGGNNHCMIPKHEAAAKATTTIMTRNLRFAIFISGFLKPLPLNLPRYWMSTASINQSLASALLAPRDNKKTCLLPSAVPGFAALCRENKLGLNGGKDDWLVPRRDLLPQKSAAAAGRDDDDGEESVVTFPTLHCFGAADNIMPSQRSLALASAYRGSETFAHPGGHVVPNDSESLERFVEFVSRFYPSSNNKKKE